MTGTKNLGQISDVLTTPCKTLKKWATYLSEYYTFSLGPNLSYTFDERKAGILDVQ